MLIILEGCDGAGKTTLADALTESLTKIGHASLIHMSQPKGDAFCEYLGALDGYYPRRSHHLVIDRLHLGELVYGPMFRGESQLDSEKVDILHQRITTLGGLLVHVDAPLTVIEERVSVRGDDFVQINDLVTIYSAYRKLAGEITDVPLVTVDTRRPNTVKQIIRLAKALERAA